MYFLASVKVASVPAGTSPTLRRSSESPAKALPMSSGNVCVLSQTPFSAISRAVASSMRWPCSMHRTPASIARWIAAAV